MTNGRCPPAIESDGEALTLALGLELLLADGEELTLGDTDDEDDADADALSLDDGETEALALRPGLRARPFQTNEISSSSFRNRSGSSNSRGVKNWSDGALGLGDSLALADTEGDGLSLADGDELTLADGEGLSDRLTDGESDGDGPIRPSVRTAGSTNDRSGSLNHCRNVTGKNDAPGRFTGVGLGDGLGLSDADGDELTDADGLEDSDGLTLDDGEGDGENLLTLSVGVTE